MIKKTLLFATLTALPSHAQELVVYTYDSFTSEWGPGPLVEAAFEAECDCDVTFVGTGDGAAMVARLQLEGPGTDADVVLGLDTNLIQAARQTGLFTTAPDDLAQPDLPIAWQDDVFVPFDWSYFAFVYESDALANVPASFEELAASDISIVIQDPRSSTPGLGLLMWIDALYGDDAGQIWGGLADNIVTVTPGWSEAYGLFLEGEADMVLSYTTSPAYHLIAEEDAGKDSAMFDEGHYLQVEVAAALAGSDQPELAAQFLRFISSQAFQSELPTTQWMYPAYETDLPEGYDTLNVPEIALLQAPELAADRRDAALALWRNALSQ
ncbi:thiamine ABC transporter substrate binding subunit [Pontivivens nitratireducens]|uniref:Thiamine-binding periplasmic protein n=1 Tax=Pontivivens nitratireducens TaxID=2758038 RepID=A0A6G7VJV8_9RHOB|nr:thiamine ABC transporter substrate binding subunit [Pontibrevibacter nitratireducens]QIK40180.1 thiamine ABC transporter substrate binding subunit [Pontibrevibacter nitratireducens]